MNDKVLQIPATMVLMRGVLCGIDRQADGELLLRKEMLAGPYRVGTKRYRYTQCTVLHAPIDLPDGDCTITTDDGFHFSAIRTRGMWLDGDPQQTSQESSRESA
ncbi:MAG TPA: hypothetical protein VIY53_16720 [Acidobacteriaceae bacterium]